MEIDEKMIGFKNKYSVNITSHLSLSHFTRI